MNLHVIFSFHHLRRAHHASNIYLSTLPGSTHAKRHITRSMSQRPKIHDSWKVSSMSRLASSVNFGLASFTLPTKWNAIQPEGPNMPKWCIHTLLQNELINFLSFCCSLHKSCYSQVLSTFVADRTWLIMTRWNYLCSQKDGLYQLDIINQTIHRRVWTWDGPWARVKSKMTI